MREFVLLMVCMFVIVGVLGVTGEFELVQASPFTDIDVDIAYSMITNGSYPDLVLLDVRTKSEYDGGHIYQAVWIPVTELEARIEELAGHEEHEVMVYCLSGGRSANASGILDMYNFTKIYNMVGGISAWESEGYPTWIATVHNLNSTINYDTIQAAINANQTLDGHTIFVEEGTYYENVVVSKSISLIGENRDKTIIDGDNHGNVVHVRESNSSISHFMIRNSGCSCAGYGGVQVENGRRNINVKDNYIIQNGHGVKINSALNIHIAGNILINNSYGLSICHCAKNSILGNIVIKNRYNGVTLYNSSFNNVLENIIVNNNLGLYISGSSSRNRFFHNRIAENNEQAYSYSPNNTWDNGFEGNYWGNYAAFDLNHDGIADGPYEISGNNVDQYPLMGMFHSFNTSMEEFVNVVSNSTIEDFQYFKDNSTIKMFVSNMTTNQTCGFCRVAIPHALMNVTNIEVIIDNDKTLVLYQNYTLYDNGTHRWIYFSYHHSKHELVIIPEFPSFFILPLFVMATLLVAIVYTRKKQDTK